MFFPITYIRLLVRALKLGPTEQHILLHGTELSPNQLDLLDQQVSQADLQRILTNLLALVPQPGLGFQLASRLSLAAHGPLGQLLSASPNLLTAWDALQRYQWLRLPLVNVECRQQGADFVFELNVPDELGDVGLFLLQILVITIQRSVELVLGRSLQEARIEFILPTPTDTAAYSRYLSGQLLFNCAANRMIVPMALMQLPNPYGDSRLWQQALTLCEQLQPDPPASPVSLTEQVRQLLQQQSGKLWSLEQIAAHFHLSPRTVIRRLKTEGVRYQQILDRELERQAKLYLRTPGHTVESVAAALGYQDASAFRRAFRRWCGMSPSEWQKDGSF
ncbi:MAG TPA: AraC family transcriptional regulator ligand-binding domain-containing protein [Dongiaceae bacterium]|nr:AraC family transcriptional regulator ligand-binding domain-containing protein [Dongiaceae bacterium]